ncbi:hypothetical protein K502DRAFT_353521 [Neoconidiobolus thromboides FSU 785]|nr:hypothetical protein K502DRAFT_353521 [Neoconidiobolus thromboides FSU 785]
MLNFYGFAYYLAIQVVGYVVLLTIKLYRCMRLIYDQGENVDNGLSKKAMKKIILLISRISLYSIVMIITHPDLVINQTISEFIEIDSLELDMRVFFSFLSAI